MKEISIEERLDNLKLTLIDQKFLDGEGLSNEVNIRLFCYNPKQEPVIEHFIGLIQEKPLKSNPLVVDMYKIFIEICQYKKILDKCSALEEKKGTKFLEEQFARICDNNTFAKKIMEHYREDNQLILIYGVGKVFPLMRVHALLNAIQPLKNDIPVVVMYPGTFDGHYVKLFNQLKPNEYYRAFNLI